MAKRLGPPILLGVITVLAILFLTGNGDDGKLQETFEVGAVYRESGHVEVSFQDRSQNTNSVVLQVLGMEEPFQKTLSGDEFVEAVPFPDPPKYGWKVHPVVLDIEHAEFGHVQLKTEVRSPGEPVPPVIYARP